MFVVFLYLFGDFRDDLISQQLGGKGGSVGAEDNIVLPQRNKRGIMIKKNKKTSKHRRVAKTFCWQGSPW